MRSMANPRTGIVPGLLATAYNVSAPWTYMKALFQDWLGLINWARAYGKELPDIKPELSLFIESSETGPSMIQTRNKAIITKLVDLNKRYLQLNTTPVKDTYNRIMATTVLNSIRAPDKASDYIAEAELDLGKLFRDTLGSNKDSKEPISWKRYIATLPAIAGKALYNRFEPQAVHDYFNPTLAAQVYDKYSVVEPHNIVTKHDREASLPSSIIGRVGFPDEQTSGRYVPQYEKQQYLPAPMDLYPVYKKKKAIDGPTVVTLRPSPTHRRALKRYRRGQKMRR